MLVPACLHHRRRHTAWLSGARAQAEGIDVNKLLCCDEGCCEEFGPSEPPFIFVFQLIWARFPWLLLGIWCGPLRVVAVLRREWTLEKKINKKKRERKEKNRSARAAAVC